MSFTPFGPAPGLMFWQPGDDGFLGANYDPAGASGGGLLIAGTLYLARLPVRAPGLISNLWPGLSVAGVGASTGSFAGLYSPSGALLTGSADIGGVLTGPTGYHPCALTTPQAFAGGPSQLSWPFAAFLCNLATTQPTFIRAFNAITAAPQAVVNAATLRWGQFPAVGTALPAQLTMASMAATAFTNIIPWT